MYWFVKNPVKFTTSCAQGSFLNMQLKIFIIPGQVGLEQSTQKVFEFKDHIRWGWQGGIIDLNRFYLLLCNVSIEHRYLFKVHCICLPENSDKLILNNSGHGNKVMSVKKTCNAFVKVIHFTALCLEKSYIFL